jgi:predicted transcriptional regulator
MEKRCEKEIIFDMLKVLKEAKEMAKTTLMRSANSNWGNCQKKFELLLEKGLIAPTANKKNSREVKFRITDKGKAFIGDFQKIEESLA